MGSFKEKIKNKQGVHAYYLGALACQEGLAMNASPYERGSRFDVDWVDGYLDALYIRRL